jgi:hypothetical protein
VLNADRQLMQAAKPLREEIKDRRIGRQQDPRGASMNALSGFALADR